MKNLKSYTLVILTKKFGSNFTGATLATQKLLNNWTSIFCEIIVVTKEIGIHVEFDNLNIIKVSSSMEIYKTLKEISANDRLVCYSDDHLGYLFRLSKLKYCHTYHGNWPDAKKINFNYFLKSLFFIPAYKLALRNSETVINVSYYMDKFTKRYNEKSVVIRNGLGQLEGIRNESVYYKTIDASPQRIKLIMVGGIDNRKYKSAIDLFEILKKNQKDNLQVDIYGAIYDKNIGNRLSSFEFVRLMGHKNDIVFDEYDIFLNTSKIENLSISVCEAIASFVPVICYDVGGLNEIVIHSSNGFLAKSGDVMVLANIINDVITKGYVFEFSGKHLSEYNWSYSASQYIKIFTNDLRDNDN